jgi:hypothetical protein
LLVALDYVRNGLGFDTQIVGFGCFSCH